MDDPSEFSIILMPGVGFEREYIIIMYFHNTFVLYYDIQICGFPSQTIFKMYYIVTF